MNSPIYNEWMVEERREAAEKATAIAKEEAIAVAKEVAVKANKAIEKAKQAKEKIALEISQKKLIELLEVKFDMLQYLIFHSNYCLIRNLLMYRIFI